MASETSSTRNGGPEGGAGAAEQIRLAGQEMKIGRTADCQVTLGHLSVSHQHAVFRKTGQGWEVQDLESRYGTFVNGHRVGRKTLRAGDSVRFGMAPPYRFDGEVLHKASDAVGMALRLDDVTVRRRVGGKDKALISGVKLEIQSGSFVGILGPSGAGKTVLMDCLSSNQPPSGGAIYFDQELPLHDHLDYFRSKTGVITQEDVVFPDLTVEENLRLAAEIRFAESQHGEIPGRIESALNDVDLGEHRGKLVSKLSGGQRKRVSVAIELLSNPRLLLLDEPTSGLDPGRQAMLMETLRRLAQRGVTVVCVTHTLDTMNFFDAVVVLGIVDGTATVVYQGPPKALLPTFGAATQADLFDQLGKLEPRRMEGGTGALEAAGSGRLAAGARLSGRPAASWWRQTRVVCRRSLLSLWRDRSSRWLAIAQPPVLSVLVALSQGSRPSIFPHFFLVLLAVWLGMTLTVREIVRERNAYRRDRLAGLRPTAFVAGKVLFAMLVLAVQVAFFVAAFRCMAAYAADSTTEQELARVPVLAEFVLLWIDALGGAVFGLILSTLARSERTAVTLLPLALLPQFLFSRISSGDALLPWDKPSPFSPIALFAESYRENYDVPSRERSILAAALVAKPAQRNEVQTGLEMALPPMADEPDSPSTVRGHVALATLSLAALTRPGTAAIDLLAAEGDQYHAGWVWAEVAYLVGLTGVYGAVMVGIFIWKERTWTGGR